MLMSPLAAIYGIFGWVIQGTTPFVKLCII
jgi:hypothetical protein